MRGEDARKVMDVLLQGGEWTVRDIAQRTGLSCANVSHICACKSYPLPNRTKRVARVAHGTYAILHTVMRHNRIQGHPPLSETAQLALLKCSEKPCDVNELHELLDVKREWARVIALKLYDRKLLTRTKRRWAYFYTTTPAGLAELARYDAADAAE